MEFFLLEQVQEYVFLKTYFGDLVHFHYCLADVNFYVGRDNNFSVT